MPRPLLTIWLSLIWLLASPSLHLPNAGWVEVGAPNAAAQQSIMVDPHPVTPTRVGKQAEPRKQTKSKKQAKPTQTEPKQSAEPKQPAEPEKQAEKKPVKKAKRIGSSGLVVSTQPGFHPMRKITQPSVPVTTGTIVTPARDPRYPDVPTVPAILPETSQDRIIRCTHQGNLGGLPAGQQGTYVHNCAF